MIENAIQPEILPTEVLPTGNESILVVDDEEFQVEIVKRMLERLQ